MSLNQNYYLLILLAIVFVLFYFFKKKDGVSIIDKLKPNSAAATPFLDMYTVDFTRLVKEDKIDPVIGREEEVRRLSQVLSRRNKNNAILVGEPGVGKTAVVEALAQRIISGDVPVVLQNKRVLSLEVSDLMAGTKYRGEFEERAQKIVDEITKSARSIILFIDEVHAVVQSHGTEGAINFGDILKPALARGELQMIGATTFVEYDKYIKTDLSLERRFQPIEVKAPSVEETVFILQGVKDKYREYHKVEFTDAALDVAARLSEQLIKDRNLPDKAIDAMDEAAAMVKVSHIHENVPAILYQSAVRKNPQVAEIWRKIQAIDCKIAKSRASEREMLVKQREGLEQSLALQGLAVVDSADVEKVIKEWTARI